MDELKKQAAELGIKVDGRWSAERLQAEIDEALDAPAPVVAEDQAEEVVDTAPAEPEVVEPEPEPEPEPEVEEDDHANDHQAPRTLPIITNLTGNRNRTLGIDGFGSIQLTDSQMDDERLIAKIRHGIKTGVLSAE